MQAHERRAKRSTYRVVVSCTRLCCQQRPFLTAKNRARYFHKPMQSREISSVEARRIILSQAHRTRSGHIGSHLSVVDILATLYSEGGLSIDDPKDPDRDRFVLSKGHSALALYAVLRLRGWISEDQLNTYLANDSLFGVHPEHEIPGVEFSTGSLGHGLSFSVGAALAARMQGSARRAVCLLSDGECNEGSVWEGAMSAAHHRLSNLIAIVDANAQQCFGFTRDVLDMEPVVAKWQSFGWDVHEVDGHDRANLARKMRSLELTSGPPHVLIARNVFGKGVSFMQNSIKWHYAAMSDAEYAQAMSEVG